MGRSKCYRPWPRSLGCDDRPLTVCSVDTRRMALTASLGLQDSRSLHSAYSAAVSKRESYNVAVPPFCAGTGRGGLEGYDCDSLLGSGSVLAAAVDIKIRICGLFTVFLFDT